MEAFELVVTMTTQKIPRRKNQLSPKMERPSRSNEMSFRTFQIYPNKDKVSTSKSPSPSVKECEHCDFKKIMTLMIVILEPCLNKLSPTMMVMQKELGMQWFSNQGPKKIFQSRLITTTNVVAWPLLKIKLLKTSLHINSTVGMLL